MRFNLIVFSTNMEELKDYTDTVLYEKFRTDKLQSQGHVQDNTVFKEIK